MSITTWPGPVAHLPLVRVRGLNCASRASNPNAKFGELPLPRVLPWRSTSLARSELPSIEKIAPAALRTPGSLFTRGSSEAGTVALPLLDSLTTCLPEITALVFWYDAVKMLSKACSIVSVRTYVPLTIATPSTTASAVSTVRTGRATSPRIATRLTPSAPPSSG